MAQGYELQRLGRLALDFLNGQLVILNHPDIQYDPQSKLKKYSVCLQWDGVMSPSLKQEIKAALHFFGDCDVRTLATRITAVYMSENESLNAERFFHALKYKTLDFTAVKSESFLDEENIDIEGDEEIEPVSID